MDYFEKLNIMIDYLVGNIISYFDSKGMKCDVLRKIYRKIMIKVRSKDVFDHAICQKV